MMKKILAVLLLFSTLFLTGCFDLGTGLAQIEYDDDGNPVIPDGYTEEEYLDRVWSDGYDYSAYYELFDTVTFVLADRSEEDVDVEDSLFTESTCQTGEWGEDDDEIPSNAYMMMAIKMEDDVTLDDFSLAFLSSDSGTLHVYFYVLDEIPDLIPMYDEADAVSIKTNAKGLLLKDNDGDYLYNVAEGYYKPDTKTPLAHVAVQFGGQNTSMFVNHWKKNGASYSTVPINAGQYLAILFYTNTGYGRVNGQPPMSFQPINMLFSVS